MFCKENNNMTNTTIEQYINLLNSIKNQFDFVVNIINYVKTLYNCIFTFKNPFIYLFYK